MNTTVTADREPSGMEPSTVMSEFREKARKAATGVLETAVEAEGDRLVRVFRTSPACYERLAARDKASMPLDYLGLSAVVLAAVAAFTYLVAEIATPVARIAVDGVEGALVAMVAFVACAMLFTLFFTAGFTLLRRIRSRAVHGYTDSHRLEAHADSVRLRAVGDKAVYAVAPDGRVHRIPRGDIKDASVTLDDGLATVTLLNDRNQAMLELKGWDEADAREFVSLVRV